MVRVPNVRIDRAGRSIRTRRVSIRAMDRAGHIIRATAARARVRAKARAMGQGKVAVTTRKVRTHIARDTGRAAECTAVEMGATASRASVIPVRSRAPVRLT